MDDYPSKLCKYKVGNDTYSVFIIIEKGATLIISFPYTLTIFAGVIFQ